MQRAVSLLSSFAVASALGAMGCSSRSSAAPNVCDTMTPVSFGNNVAPAFLASGCSNANVCHGQMNNAEEDNLFLGDIDGGTDPKIIYDQLVGVPSKENPSMNMVTARDTSKSYLWHKLEGDQNSNAAVAGGCTATCSLCSPSEPCGVAMPDQGAALAMGDPASFCAIGSWISQGAKNN